MSTSVRFIHQFLKDPKFKSFVISKHRNSGNKYHEKFLCHVRIFPIAASRIESLCTKQDQVMNLLRRLHFAAHNCASTSREDFSKFLTYFEAFMQGIRVFFTVPKQQTSHYTTIAAQPNRLLGFIKFTLRILEEILSLEIDFIISVRSSIQVLWKEVGCLVIFLEDTPIWQPADVDETGNALTDIEGVVDEVGRFIYSFFFTWDDPLDLGLPDLLLKIEFLKAKIKEHCIRVSKLPSYLIPKTRVTSLFMVDSFLDDLKDIILNRKADINDSVTQQIVELSEELTLLRSCLLDIASQPQAQVDNLVMRGADIAYEVEYVVNSFPPNWYLDLRLDLVMEKIKLTRTAANERKKNNIDVRTPDAPMYSYEQASSPPIAEDTFVGFKNEAIKIAEQLVTGPSHLQIITIFGMPGLGKTTLAKQLYNDPSVVYRFDKRAWCVVSQAYQRRNVLLQVLMSINFGREDTEEMEDEELVEYLYKSLKGRRYLIIFDDIWDRESWDDLKICFPNDSNASRILFTTRHKDVAVQASPNGIINELPFLSHAECWDLFQQGVFKKEESCPPELTNIGKQIAKNCRGLPLAVVTVAAILANMEKKPPLWHTVASSLSSIITEDSESRINILELSYKHLPMHLKPCFLYLAIFPEDSQIPARKLISLWVAEGFIKREVNKCQFDVAEEYLMALIDRSLILVGERRSDGGVKTCSIHDLLHGMCLRIAKEQNFLKESQRGHTRTASLDHHQNIEGIELSVHLRYLEVPRPCLQPPPSVEILHKLEFLTLNCFRNIEILDIFHNMVNLRKLHLRRRGFFGKSICCRATNDESFQMKNLQEISVVYIRDEKDMEILRRLPNLCRLRCQVEAFLLPLSLDFLGQLKSLSLCLCRPMERNLGHSWISLPLNLKKLTLRGSVFSSKQISAIGGLQNLEILILKDLEFRKRQWETNEGEFQKLKFLELNSVEILQWNTSGDHFPILQQLVFRRCYLKVIPSSLGDIPTLHTLRVEWCSPSTSQHAWKIKEEQWEMGNEELEVIVSDVREHDEEYDWTHFRNNQ